MAVPMASKLGGVMLALTALYTFYSLSQLHSLSVQHATQDASIEAAAHVPVILVTGTPVKVVGSSSLESIAVKPVSQKLSTRKVFIYPHTELWGDVVIWGTKNTAVSAEDCGDQCRNLVLPTDKPECNVFVYCGDASRCGDRHKQCWLKHMAHPEASKPAKQGDAVYWTSGTLDVDMRHGDTTSSRPLKAQLCTGRHASTITGTRSRRLGVSWRAAVKWAVSHGFCTQALLMT